MEVFHKASKNVNTNYVVMGIAFIVVVKVSRDLQKIRSWHVNNERFANRQLPPKYNRPYQTGTYGFKIRQMEDSYFLLCMHIIPISYGYTLWKHKNQSNLGAKVALCGTGNLCLSLMFGLFWDTYCSRDYGPMEALFVFFDFIISSTAASILFGIIKWRNTKNK
eukprot:6927_1